MDTQSTEIIGRNRLINELLAAGLEVAEPIRDRGIDLIVYLDIDDEIKRFAAVPIQLKASTSRGFTVAQKYDKFPNLIIAYVWGLTSDLDSTTYALTQREAVAIAETMGWTKTASWKKGGYSTTAPSARLIELLEPYRMTPKLWRQKLLTELQLESVLEPH
jgi:hypothetical protein